MNPVRSSARASKLTRWSIFWSMSSIQPPEEGKSSRSGIDDSNGGWGPKGSIQPVEQRVRCR